MLYATVSPHAVALCYCHRIARRTHGHGTQPRAVSVVSQLQKAPLSVDHAASVAPGCDLNAPLFRLLFCMLWKYTIHIEEFVFCIGIVRLKPLLGVLLSLPMTHSLKTRAFAQTARGCNASRFLHFRIVMAERQNLEEGIEAGRFLSHGPCTQKSKIEFRTPFNVKDSGEARLPFRREGGEDKGLNPNPYMILITSYYMINLGTHEFREGS